MTHTYIHTMIHTQREKHTHTHTQREVHTHTHNSQKNIRSFINTVRTSLEEHTFVQYTYIHIYNNTYIPIVKA